MLTRENKEYIITACFESEAMREHLTAHCEEISHRQWVDIIRGAPIPLHAKAGLIRNVDDASYREISEALEVLNLKEDQFFLYSWTGYERVDGKLEPITNCIGPCRDLGKVREHLAEELYDVPLSEDLWEHRREECYWAELELFEPDGQNGFRTIYTYYLLADQVCYFHRNYNSPQTSFWASTSRLEYSWQGVHLNIDIPFLPGEIVTVDSMPFARPRRICLLEVGTDCCGVQGLYWNKGAGKWDTGAVKHGSIYDDPMTMISPLYRMERFTGPLEEREQYLLEVGCRIAGDAENGRKVWNEINGYGD